MSAVAIIGGSGLYSLGADFELESALQLQTPFGETSAAISQGRWHGARVAFLPRHGPEHRVPPHKINYRANIWALKESGVRRIIAVNAVGGISAEMAPLTLALPDQLIDYSSGREMTFFDGDDGKVEHVDFTHPYSSELRNLLIEAAQQAQSVLIPAAVYACTNGPRLETAAEIKRLQQDGCDLVGMTGMPEAVLARELGIEYAAVALVVNWAAGIHGDSISMEEIIAIIEQGMGTVNGLLKAAVKMSSE